MGLSPTSGENLPLPPETLAGRRTAVLSAARPILSAFLGARTM